MSQLDPAHLAPALPGARGPLSAAVIACLRGGELDANAQAFLALGPDPLADDDLHLALYVLYELHYRGFAGVLDEWEWHPSLLAVRRELEVVFLAGLFDLVGPPASAEPGDMDLQLRAILGDDHAPPLGRHLEARATIEQFHEFVLHRSAYQLKEADPHSWAIPRLSGRPKAALLEIQADEYGGGVAGDMHAELFARTMRELGLDERYGAYLERLPGATLATVNLMSLFGLHRRWRGAIVGHLAAFEMSSSLSNRRYANALRRLGASPAARAFYDVHVVADAVHENVAAVDLAGGLAAQEPALAGEVLFGARALVALEALFAEHLLDRWNHGRSSLREAVVAQA